MSEHGWIKKSLLERLEALATNHPQLRIKKGTASPRFYIAGSGTQAAYCIDLPASSAAAPQAAGTSTFPCKIVSKSGAFYTVTSYRNGVDNPYTGTEKVYVLQLSFVDELPAGTWIMASDSAIGITGGTEFP